MRPTLTKVRIKFQNYLFKADKRINHHLGHNKIFPADRIRILLRKINRLLLHFWLLEVRIKFWELSISGPNNDFVIKK